MKKDDENRPATMEEIRSANQREKELDAMFEEEEKQTEKINLVPLNEDAEKYICDRYPIRVLYARASLQRIAICDYKTTLTEEEMQEMIDALYDNFDEIEIVVSDAIGTIIKERK